MANYKVVDADQLDADLASVADAIRSKGGTSDKMVFPDGFVSAVQNVPDTLEQRCLGTLVEYESINITTVPQYAFRNCKSLKKAHMKNVSTVGMNAFEGCSALEDVHMPFTWTIGAYGFSNCNISKLLFINPATIGGRAFEGNPLEMLVIRKNGVATLDNIYAFDNTPIANGTGYIYVPSAKVDSYKSATNWSTFANQIRAIEDYPEVLEGWS